MMHSTLQRSVALGIAASCLGMVLSVIGVGFAGSAIKAFLLVHRAP